MNQKDTDRLMKVIFPEVLSCTDPIWDKIQYGSTVVVKLESNPVPESCWGCAYDYLKNWSKFDLGHITSFVTGNSDVLVCPDCREDIESIEKENEDESNNGKQNH